MPQPDNAKLNALFELLCHAAAAGHRCPTREELPPYCRQLLTDLARRGDVRVEIFAHNWRVVTILVGPHAGKSTAPAPLGKKPYQILTKNGRLYGHSI